METQYSGFCEWVQEGEPKGESRVGETETALR